MAISGSIDDVPVVDVLQFVHMSGKTGTLVLGSGAGPAMVEFVDGNIVYARSPGTRSLGELLVREGDLAPDELAGLLRQQESTPLPLGRLLMERGLASRDVLSRHVTGQIRAALLEIAAWREGQFEFHHGEVRIADGIRVDVGDVLPDAGLNTQFLLLEAVNLLDERRRDADKGDAEGGRRGSGAGAVGGVRELSMPQFTPGPLPGAAAQLSAARIVGLPDAPPARVRAGVPAHVPAREACLLAGDFEGPVLGPVLRRLRAAACRVLGHVPLREVRAQLLESRPWPRSLAVVWRIGPDRPAGPSPLQQAALLEQARARHPGWQVVALVADADPDLLRRLYAAGTRAALPLEEDGAGTAATAESLVAVLRQIWDERRREADLQAAELRAWVRARQISAEMQRALQSASVALQLMRVASQCVDRASLFLARGPELVGLGGFGRTRSGQWMAEALRGVVTGAPDGTPLRECLGRGTAFIGHCRQLGMGSLFFDIAGPPACAEAVLVPLAGPTRTIGVLYGDNGPRDERIRGVHTLELAAAEAGFAYEHALLLRQLQTRRAEGIPA